MPPIVSNLYEAKTNLSQLVDRAAAGEEIIIAKNGVPLARLVPLEARASPRTPGWEGAAWIADDFDEPLPSELLAAFGCDHAAVARACLDSERPRSQPPSAPSGMPITA
jgi:prevent-host-death family protein